jgi:hypothetical protein
MALFDTVGQTEIDDLGPERALILQMDHDITRFDVPMNEVLFVQCS